MIYDAKINSGVYLNLSIDSHSITGTSDSTTLHSWTVPIGDQEIAWIDDQQTYFTPIKELFGVAHQVISAMKPSFLTAGVDIATSLQDIFGTRLFQRTYLAQAWREAKPGNMALTLKFKYGMKNEWSGKKEVVQPLLALKQLTLPYTTTSNSSVTGADIMTAPGPTAMSVYTNFSKDLIKSILSLGNLIQTATVSLATGSGTASTTGVGTSIVKEKTASDKILTDAINSLGGANYKYLWTVSLIAYKSGADGGETVLLTSPPMVCTESSLSFGTQLDEDSLPIEGTININLSSQMPSTNMDYGGAGSTKIWT